LLTEKDVRELLGLRAEGKNLDYKESMNWGTATAEQKAAVVKDALAMANTQDGGKIVLGVRDGDYEAIGLADEEFQSFDVTRFADFLNRYADPSFECAIQKFIIDGKKFVTIEVPEFNDVPIICKTDANDPSSRQILKRGATYIRTNRAASEVVPDAEAMRDLMNRAAVKRGDELLRMVPREEFKHFPLAMSLQQAAPGSYIGNAKNESKHKVSIETIQILRGDTSYESPLTEQVKPRKTDDWTLEPGSSKSFFWAPQYDPRSMLQSLVRSPDPNFPDGRVIPIALVLTVRVDGKHLIEKKYIQNVLFQGNQILPWGP
jgi:predicted HTH transcriptional regulator